MAYNVTIEDLVQERLDALKSVLQRLPAGGVAEAVKILMQASVSRKTVFVVGNGGSASTASHMACDLAKTVQRGNSPGLRVVSLADNAALLTALGNDESFEEIFARQLSMLGQRDDLVIVISGSGRSPNCVRAVEEARRLGMFSIALLGMGGGRVGELADMSIVVPSDDYGLIEDAHLAINHIITECLKVASPLDPNHEA